MARTATPVDRVALEAAIQQAEANGPLRTQNDVWKAAADIYNKTAAKPISFSVVLLRAGEWGTILKTKSARGQGRTMSAEQISAMQAGRGKRVARAEKFSGDERIQKHIVHLKQYVPERYAGLVARIEKGSMKAATALNCASCMGFEDVANQVRNCTTKICAMYPFRPYQKATGEVNEDELLNAGADEEVPKTPLETAA